MERKWPIEGHTVAVNQKLQAGAAGREGQCQNAPRGCRSAAGVLKRGCTGLHDPRFGCQMLLEMGDENASQRIPS